MVNCPLCGMSFPDTQEEIMSMTPETYTKAHRAHNVDGCPQRKGFKKPLVASHKLEAEEVKIYNEKGSISCVTRIRERAQCSLSEAVAILHEAQGIRSN